MEKRRMKKIKVSRNSAFLLLGGLLLFSQVSSLKISYLAREYVVLLIIQLYFLTTYLIVPKVRSYRESRVEKIVS